MTWDEYYLGICDAVSQGSKCLSRQIGAILVKDKVVICTGYNGPPRGVPHCTPVRAPCKLCKGTGKFSSILWATGECHACGGKGWVPICPRHGHGYKSGEGLHLCPAAHAEANAIVQAARLGINVNGATMYMNCPVPCKDCMVKIINAGIAEVVCTEMDLYDHLSGWLLENSDLKVRTYVLP